MFFQIQTKSLTDIKMKGADLDEMIVFDRPITIKGDIIYGFIKSSNIGNDGDIAEYVAYLADAERFESLKALIGSDWQLWTYTDEIHSIPTTVGYKIFKFEEPIEWIDGEVDIYEGTPCFIFKEELIDRYTQKEIKE